jgi:hypothetical protein
MDKVAATVYRIETKDGQGMYGSGGFRRAAGEAAYDGSRHPGPGEDGKMRKVTEKRRDTYYFDYSPFHFGFISVEQLRNWIYKDEWLLSLHESGHVLAIVRSEDVIEGFTQAIFVRPEKYQKVSIKEYFNLKDQYD